MDDDHICVRIWKVEDESISRNSGEVTMGLGTNQECWEIRLESNGQGECCLSIVVYYIGLDWRGIITSFGPIISS
jgi:hypothetical protein